MYRKLKSLSSSTTMVLQLNTILHMALDKSVQLCYAATAYHLSPIPFPMASSVLHTALFCMEKRRGDGENSLFPVPWKMLLQSRDARYAGSALGSQQLQDCRKSHDLRMIREGKQRRSLANCSTTFSSFCLTLWITVGGRFPSPVSHKSLS